MLFFRWILYFLYINCLINAMLHRLHQPISMEHNVSSSMHIHSYYLESTWIFFLLDIETDLKKKTILLFKFFPSLNQDLYTMIIGYEIRKINSKFLPFCQLNEGYQKRRKNQSFLATDVFIQKFWEQLSSGFLEGSGQSDDGRWFFASDLISRKFVF